MAPRSLYILFFSLACLFGNAQNPGEHSRPWSFALSPHYGVIVPHTKQMEHLIQGHSYGAHGYLFRPSHHKSYWQEAYNFPEQGFDFTFINTGNSAQLGQQYVAGFLLNLPLNHRKEEFNPTSRAYTHWLGLALGGGYSTKVWDLENNHQAAVIGSHADISLGLQYSVRIVRFGKSELRAGLRITHFSNGAFQLPNLGTNNAGIFLSYFHHQEKNDVHENLPMPVIEKNRTSISAMIGFKEIPPPYGKKFTVFVTSLLQERRISYKSSFGIGADFFYNSSLKVLMERKSEAAVAESKVIQSGLLFSYTLHFNQFELKMQQGFYIHDNWKVDGNFYHRFGLRYRVTDHLFAQLTLKTHFAKADYGEWGMGYSF